MDMPEPPIKRYALVPGGRDGAVRRFHLARRLERMEEVAGVGSGEPDPGAGHVGRIAVRVQPRAARDEIAGERDGALLVRVTAPPVDGKANDAVCKLLAKRLGVARSRVAVVRGASSRDKLIEMEGVEAEALRRELGLP
jgi:uncharacterized protein (TIGR00251 family)